ncbi:MAG: RNA polymerase sigma factor [Acidimicrobiales bacterium]
MEAAQAGDRDALDALLRRHYDRVHAICRRMTGNDHDALDATQDALIAITRGLDRYDGRAAFTTWAYRVTTNACLDELRRRKRRPVPASDDRDEMGSPPESGSAQSGAPHLDQAVADRLSIDGALQALPAEFRAPVVLRDVLGLDYAEIADVLAIPPGTVRSRIARGRRALADQLGAARDDGNQTAPGHVERNAP